MSNGQEIERKFLVTDDSWRNGDILTIKEYRQGYFDTNDPTIRIRIIDKERGRLTVKGGGPGRVRTEEEVDIPVGQARSFMDAFCGDRIVTKKRFVVRHKKHEWEVDVFEGANDGLVLAEVELDKADENFERPDWIGQEVTDDGRFYNAALAQNPQPGA